jgi:hypothetical protein
MNGSEKRNPPERDVIFRVSYVYEDMYGQHSTAAIEYPVSKEDISLLLSDAGIDGKSRRLFYSESFESAIPGIADTMPDYVGLDELNYLAARIQALDPGQREVYAAVIESRLHCRCMADLINLTDNLVNFTLIPAGKQTNAGAGALTSKGFLTESGVFVEPYRWPGDIPSGQRAAGHLDKYFVPEPVSVIKAVALSPLVTQLHAACGDYMVDALNNVAALEALRSAEYLLLLDCRGAFLTAAAHAYREGTPAYNRFMSAERSQDTFVFALHVTNVWAETGGEPELGPVTGDCVMVDLREQQWDIRLNAVKPTLSDNERHFTHDDYQAVLSHLERVSNSHQDADCPEPLTAAELISTVNRRYMEQTAYPLLEKIRVCREAAKGMLAHGDATVYRLKNNGAVPEPRISAVRMRTNRPRKEAYAINPADMAGFANWAKRAASDMAKQAQERGEQKKTRAGERG